MSAAQCVRYDDMLQESLREMRFTFAYERAALITDIVRGLEHFDEDVTDFIKPTSRDFIMKVSRPNKRTVLHDFIFEVTEYGYYEMVFDDLEPTDPVIRMFLRNIAT